MSVAKLIHIKESLALRYLASKELKEKRFTFRQRHNCGFNQRNILQESIKKTDS